MFPEIINLSITSRLDFNPLTFIVTLPHPACVFTVKTIVNVPEALVVLVIILGVIPKLITIPSVPAKSLPKTVTLLPTVP
ncbi:MAG: hypothetical protein AB1422_11525, partial [bacterium]